MNWLSFIFGAACGVVVTLLMVGLLRAAASVDDRAPLCDGCTDDPTDHLAADEYDGELEALR